MSRDKEYISDIIYGKMKYDDVNYFENIMFSFTQIQMAAVKGLKVSYLCFELTGEMILELRRLNSYNIELKNIYVYKYDEKSPYFAALRDMGGQIVPINAFDECSEDELLLDVWDYSVRCVDYKSFIYKLYRNLNRKWPDKIKRHNPISRKYDDKTVKAGFWRGIRPGDFDRMLYYQSHIKELEETYDMLEDDDSKNTFMEIIRAVCWMDDWRGKQGRPDQKYWEYYRHLDDECWVNCGSAYGDSILWYIMNGYPYQYIDAYEGDQRTAEVLTQTIKTVGISVNIHNQYIGVGEGSEGNFDSLYANRKVTLINMDIEGAEINVLQGAKKIIAEQKPVLAICAYHRPEDLVELPRVIKSCCDDYVFYLRKYPCSTAGHVGEFIYYMVPRERMIN